MSVLGWSTTAMASRYTHVFTPIHSDLASRLDALLWSSRDIDRDQLRPHLRPRPRTLAPTLWRSQRFALSVGGGGGI